MLRERAQARLIEIAADQVVHHLNYAKLTASDPRVKEGIDTLLAIVPVAILGAWRQHRYGNVRLPDGVTLGLLSVPGVVVGSALANALPERALKLGFAGLQLFFAIGLARRALGRKRV